MQGDTQDYISTVKRMRSKNLSGRTITQDDISELRKLKKAYSAQGARSDIKDGCVSWTQFCNDIGRPRSTVDDWLSDKKQPQRQTVISRSHKLRSLWWAMKNLVR